MKTSYENGDEALGFDGLEADIDAGRRAIVVLAALELGLFEELTVDIAQPVDEVASALIVPKNRLLPLLEALAAMGYLVRGDDFHDFAIHPDAARFLTSSSPGYRGHELLRWVRTLRGWSWLSEVIQRDEPRYVGSLKNPGIPTHKTHQCLAARGHRSGLDLIEELSPPRPERVLDLGGGTGGYTKALLDTFPSVHVTLFDLPEVIELAGAHLDVESCGDRLKLVEGDFVEEIPEGPFDLVLIANVLHIFDPDSARRLVHRAAKALGAGGRLVIRDGMVEPDRRTPEAALLFGVHMLVFSDDGRIYSTDEVAAMIESAGLEVTRVIRRAPDVEGAAIVGQKPVG